MDAVETLLTLLLVDSRNIAARMAAAGFSEDETRGAWNYARQAGYTEATGLGQDRLTEAGKIRARARHPEARVEIWSARRAGPTHIAPARPDGEPRG